MRGTGTGGRSRKRSSKSKRKKAKRPVATKRVVKSAPVVKVFGGVRVTLARVEPTTNLCSGCGRTHQECSEWWDKELGVTGHASDTGAKSEYVGNLRKQRDAIVRGLDPYCFQAGLRAMGYTPNWTPHRPSGTFDPVAIPYRAEVRHGKKGKKPCRKS